MFPEINGLKATLKHILRLQREKGIKSLSSYRELLKTTPTEESWRFERESPFYDSMQGMIPLETLSPVYILETAINTIDEYLEAIDNFNEDQFSAFLLGLGLNWLPLHYWGMKELDNYLAKIDKALAFYKELEAEVSAEDLWRHKKQGFFEPLATIIPPETYKPSEALRMIRELVAGMIRVLSHRLS